jgi:mono/diheme cytochrome c family protein
LIALTAFALAGCPEDNSDQVTTTPPDGPLTATLSADSTDPDGDTLNHTWHVTAGTLSARTGRTVKWTVPSGGGLHFAYLTVSDGRGAYVERTLALELGTPTGPPTVTSPRPAMYAVADRDHFDGANLRATLSITRNFLPSGKPRRIYLPAEPVRLTAEALPDDPNLEEYAVEERSDAHGEVVFPKLPVGTWRDTEQNTLSTGTTSLWQKTRPPARPDEFRLHGHVSLREGVLCGMFSNYKRMAVTAKVRYSGLETTVNAYGDYALRIPAGTTLDPTMTVQCESMSAEVPVPLARLVNPSNLVETSVTLANSAPSVSAVHAVANGVEVGATVADALSAPSNNFARADHFLTYKGVDTADSACNYYRAIGATPSCGAYGAIPPEAIQFDEWRRIRKLAPYDSVNREFRATYVNRVDLNLVRDMHAVKNGSEDYAFYVCNYPKPKSSAQADVDAAIADARAGKNLVACVAMDYAVTQGTNFNRKSSAYRAFTKFYVFGPGGNLISSVNLDGRGEKFVPGACVVCHGGSSYAGRFPASTFPIQHDTNGPSAAIGARFLPFDLGNYQFASRFDLSKSWQQGALKQLNFLVRDIENDFAFEPPSQPGPPLPVTPTPAMRLIDGWYAGKPNRDEASELDEFYLPPAWTDTGTLTSNSRNPGTAPSFYLQIVARTCRTCHVALPSADWDTRAIPRSDPHVCGGSSDLHLNGKMANSKVTFDELWLSVAQSTDRRAMMDAHLGCGVGGVGISAPFPNP